MCGVGAGGLQTHISSLYCAKHIGDLILPFSIVADSILVLTMLGKIAAEDILKYFLPRK